jgi:hypothetical protein
MTKAYPNIIIKPTDEPQDIGLKGGPVKKDTRSWREKAGKRRTFGAPTGGWLSFDKEGNVVKRRTSTEPAKSSTPKGYTQICYECAILADLGDEFNVMQSILLTGTCDICGTEHVARMGMEQARYQALLDRIGIDSGEAAER